MQQTKLNKANTNPNHTQKNSFFQPNNSMAKKPFFQTKLTVGPSDDRYEREADNVADKVMRMESSNIVPARSVLPIQRLCQDCEKEQELQRKSETSVDSSHKATVEIQPAPVLHHTGAKDIVQMRRRMNSIRRPKLSLYQADAETNFFRQLAVRKAREINSVQVDSSTDCPTFASFGATPYYSGEDIIEKMSKAAWCTEHPLDEVHIFSHGNSHVIDASEGTRGRSLYSDSSYAVTDQGGRSVGDISPDIFSPSASITLHGCQTAVGDDSIAETLLRHLLGTSPRARVYGHSQSGTCGRTSDWTEFSGRHPDGRRVRNNPDHPAEVQRKLINNSSTQLNQPHSLNTVHPVQRKCAACEEEEHVQLKNSTETQQQSEAPSIVSDALGSGGSPMDNNTRSFMENRFGYDFSQVKIHTDSIATKSADSINALAYTSGNNVVFGNGQYSPATNSGKRLLAHELTHVVQQGKYGVRKSIQRQHIRLHSGRFVGDTITVPNNLKEDVLSTMDSLHSMWSMSNANYSAEYPSVRALPDMSAVPRAAIPRTIAAISANEQPYIRHQVASSQFGLSLTAPVGTGARNNRADIYQLQNYLHANWFLSTPHYTTERTAVTSGGDPVSTSILTETLAALSRLKVSRVAEGYSRHDVLASARHITSTQRSSVEAALIPGASLSAGVVTLPTPDAICSTPAPLEADIRSIVVPYINSRATTFRTRRGSAPVLPLSQMMSMGDIAEEEMERYFGPQLRGATSVSGARYTYGQYSVRSQINDQSTTARWRNDAGRISWVNYWISTRTNNSHHCSQAEINTVARAIATDPTLTTDIDDTINGWPAEATGGINMNPYLRDATASSADIRRARWDAFTIILHEAMHHLAHPNYVNTYQQMQNNTMQILKEGVNDLFRRELWFGPGSLGTRVGTAAYNSKRASIEGGVYPYSASLVTYHGDYPQITQARAIETAVGNANVKAAYFLGHTEYLGLGPGSPGLSSTGSLTGIASYNSTDAGMTGRVNTLPGETYSQLLTRINAVPGTVFTLSGSSVSAAGSLPAQVRVAGIRYVRTIPGDTLSSIAFQNGVTISSLIRANALASTAITIGSRLLIPIH